MKRLLLVLLSACGAVEQHESFENLSSRKKATAQTTVPDGTTASTAVTGSVVPTSPPVPNAPQTPSTPQSPSTPATPGASGCAALALARNTPVSGYTTDLYTWSDSNCKQRTTAMVPNDARDAGGTYGGYARRFTYDAGGTKRTAESSHPDHHGFGFLVNHYSNTAELSTRHAGTTTVVFTGRHHALHEYKWTYTIGGQPMSATVRWLFATGKDHPIWAVTYDTSKAPKDAIRADTRSPYGDVDWDGGGGHDVSGVGWGDRNKFFSTNSPVSLASGWDYTQPNTVPYAMEWIDAPDAEMGLVQTQTYQQHDGGGYWFYGSRGTSSNGPMPQDWNWPYQLNQYEMPYLLSSKRLAWGTNYGAVGQESYPVYGDDKNLSGWPYQSYSVAIVLGLHSKNAVAAQVTQIETVQKTTLAASSGSVVTSGPAGVARTDTVTYAPAGWNHVFGTWELRAVANQVTASFVVASGSLQSPVIAIHDWTAAAPGTLTLDGAALLADDGYFASVDTATQTLWITLHTALSGAHVLSVH